MYHNPTSYQIFLNNCDLRKIKCGVKQTRFNEIMDEYSDKLAWTKETKKLIDWLYDNEMKQVTSQRLRSWMRKSLEFQKEAELKNLHKKKDLPYQKPITKKEPLWQPPR